ncbi:Ldh family oxidoreductase [Thioalkalivibrio thiocyanodenitrificans]|uniref:Ldh family oxidoreductase n=1 Tax=Thioalkalivibrio thiocyanodenitrificans TaxID=243063 RepID=UPI00036C2534|nr:Ldh family oxidoreductase [Thioalkalivibrio thiocyanodenitrificans]
MTQIALDELTELVTRAFENCGANPAMAASAARALVDADAQGLASHGVSRTPLYCAHLKNGRTDGSAVPKVIREHGGACLVDAACGMAYPACALAVQEGIHRARDHGVAFVGVTNSNHFGAAALHLRAAAEAGMVALAFGNSPAAIAPWGGQTPLFGTNPIAAVFPRQDGLPLMVDLSLSQVARGKIMVAAQKGEPIPEGWAMDAEGNPTTDAQAGLSGSMAPAGGVKGAMLALTVELLCCALTGAAFGFEADSFFSDEGNQPRIGQAFLIIDPEALAGRQVYLERMETLITKMLEDEGVRLPGARRYQLEQAARENGVEVPDALMEKIQALANG